MLTCRSWLAAVSEMPGLESGALVSHERHLASAMTSGLARHVSILVLMGKGCEASPALLQKALGAMPFLRELAVIPTSDCSWQTLLPSLTLPSTLQTVMLACSSASPQTASTHSSPR